MSTNKFYIISFYKFIQISQPKKIKSFLDNFIEDKMLRGTILLANEGINASISGSENDLEYLLRQIKILLNNKDFYIKKNIVEFLPFNKMKVRVKKEIISLGKNDIGVPKYTGKSVAPEYWNDLIKKKNIKLIDTRNQYEFNIGHFKYAINPQTKSFRDFPNKIDQLGIKKNDNIVMYCTGGIRCEKASAYLKLKGFKNIFQLDGGILNYFAHIEQKKEESYWQGECFVFDNRVTVDQSLKRGKYEQCFGCRHPITKKDIKSNEYKKGVYCPFCFNKRTEKQKKSSEDRQKNKLITL